MHRQILDLRAFERILLTNEFESAYISASTDLRNKLDLIVKNVDVDALKTWIKNLSRNDLESMSYRELRELCKRHNIFRWSRLDKDQMVEALRGIQLQSSQESS